MGKLSGKQFELLYSIKDKFEDYGYKSNIKLNDDNMNFPCITVLKDGHLGFVKVYFILNRFFVYLLKEEIYDRTYWERVGSDKGFELTKNKDFNEVNDILKSYFSDKDLIKIHFLNQLPEYFEKYFPNIYQIIYEFHKGVDFSNDDIKTNGTIYYGFSGRNDSYKISAFHTSFGNSDGWGIKIEDKKKVEVHSMHFYKYGFGLTGMNMVEACEYMVDRL